MGKKLGEILIDNGEITYEQLEEALFLQYKTGNMLGACLIELRHINGEILQAYLDLQEQDRLITTEDNYDRCDQIAAV